HSPAFPFSFLPQNDDSVVTGKNTAEYQYFLSLIIAYLTMNRSLLLPLGQKEIPVFQVCKRVFSYVKISIDFPQKQD
ncbi:hypothetical protein, partial [Sellimonas intestinalis]|uniref:hypothetical protein n=1 Tax=Sellimonas intestinalis TaxID=1653434 RepID=UPI0029439DB2